MASSYSDLLRLEKQADGEGSTTWGQKVNTVFEMIEDGIAGRAAVTHDNTANYSLTTANSATDESRNAILNIAGALTAARNTVCPTSSKVYVVKNATTGGYATTLKTTAGTGISIPNGNTTLLFCDGTNVVSAIDYLDALTVGGNFTLTGDLAVNGGDMTSTATTFNLLNATVTTLNLGGAATTIAIGSAASATTWTGQSFSLTGANSTNNTALTIQNTSNAAAASHAYLDIAVGGTTSTGDPHTRWTIPGGTSWYAGPDNSDSDSWKLGTGTAVGTSTLVTVTSGGAMTISDDLAVNGDSITTDDTTFNLVNATATTVNFAGAATTVSIGANTGTTTVNNDLVADSLSTGSGAISGGAISGTTLNVGGGTRRATLDVSNGTTNTAGHAVYEANITGANRTLAGFDGANLMVQTNTAQAADIGGYIALGGRITNASAAGYGLAGIAGRKSNSTSGNLNGYLSLTVSDDAVGMREGMRIASTRAITIPGHVAGTPTWVAGDTYLVVDSAGNIHVSAVGPAS